MKRLLLAMGMLFLIVMTVRMLAQEVMIDVPNAAYIDQIVAAVRLQDCILLTYIDVFSKSESRDALKQELKEAIAAFRSSQYINEISYQRLIDLLQVEIDVVHHLLRGDAGGSLGHVLDIRSQSILHGTPSEMYVYNTVLNLGTYDEKLEHHEGEVSAQSKNRIERELFLRRLLDTMVYYRAALRNMLYEISIYQKPGGHAIVANSLEDGVIIPIMFCPVEL